MTLYKVYCHVTLLSQYVAFEGPFGACNVDTSFLTLKGMIYHGICDLIKGYNICWRHGMAMGKGKMLRRYYLGHVLIVIVAG